MRRHQPRPGFDPEHDAPAKQSAKCKRCGTVLRFSTDGMGRLLELCPHCDDGEPLVVRVPDAKPRGPGDRIELHSKVCAVCGDPFITPHAHRVQCGSRYCRGEYRRRCDSERKRRLQRMAS